VKQEKKSSTNLVLAMRMTVHGNQHTKDGPKHTVWPRKMRLVTELLILNIIDAQAQLNHTCPQGGASDVAFRASNSGCAFGSMENHLRYLSRAIVTTAPTVVTPSLATSTKFVYLNVASPASSMALLTECPA